MSSSVIAAVRRNSRNEEDDMNIENTTILITGANLVIGCGNLMEMER